MTMDSISFGIDVSLIRQDGAATPNTFFETAAAPESLSYICRGAILVRDLDEPVQFPFMASVHSDQE